MQSLRRQVPMEIINSVRSILAKFANHDGEPPGHANAKPCLSTLESSLHVSCRSFIRKLLPVNSDQNLKKGHTSK